MPPSAANPLGPINPHSDQPVSGDISTEIPESAVTDKPLPFGVYSGARKKPPVPPPGSPAADSATGLAPVV